jgi:CheY-like chemotaxis protein
MPAPATDQEQNRTGGFGVLLVEDNPADRRLLQEELSCTDRIAELHTVSDGRQALSFLRRQDPFTEAPTPDLVILDLDLPGIDGWEVLSEVKQDPELRRIPVIILTGSANETDVIRSYDLHANGYITKPMDPDGYCELVRAIADFWLRVATLALPPDRRITDPGS